MEEILASIRRIIADDQALFAGQGASRAEVSQASPDLDARASDFARPVSAPRQDRAPQSPGPTIVARDDHPLRSAHQPDGEAVSPATTPQRGAQPQSTSPRVDLDRAAEPPLVSPATDGSVASAFHTLVAARLVQDSDKFAALTRELVRPMLKAWLDDHLPAIVERLVRAEIERVARGD